MQRTHVFRPVPGLNKPTPDLPTSPSSPLLPTFHHAQLSLPTSLPLQLQTRPHVIDRPLYILPSIYCLDGQVRHQIINSKLDIPVVTRPIDLFRLEADLVGQGDEGVVVDCECDGGVEVGAGEVGEFNWGWRAWCGWAGSEGEAVDEPLVVLVRARGGVGAVEEVRGGVNAEELGGVGDGLDEKKPVGRRWAGSGVDGKEVAGIGRREGAFHGED